MRTDAGSLRRVLLASLAALALASASAPLNAQDATAQVAVAGGMATDQRGVRSNALTVAPSFWFTPGNGVSLQVSGNATRYASQTFSLGGGVSVSAQEPLGRFLVATLTGSGG